MFRRPGYPDTVFGGAGPFSFASLPYDRFAIISILKLSMSPANKENKAMKSYEFNLRFSYLYSYSFIENYDLYEIMLNYRDEESKCNKIDKHE